MANLNILDGNLNAQQLAALIDGDAAASTIQIRTSEHRKPSFRYAGNYTPVATPTDSIMIRGSATMGVRIKKIYLIGATATAAGTIVATLVRRSTQFTTQGSAVFNAVTPGKHDTNDATATATVATIGTANITSLGTTAGNVGQGRVYFPIAASAPPFIMAWDYARSQDKPLILRGVNDFIFINFNGATIPTSGTIDYEIATEEDSN